MNAIDSNLRDLWNLISGNESVRGLAKAGADALSVKRVLDQMKAAAIIGLGLIVFGAAFKVLGVYREDPGVESIGYFICAIGTVYVAIWFLMVRIRGAFIMEGLKLSAAVIGGLASGVGVNANSRLERNVQRLARNIKNTYEYCFLVVIGVGLWSLGPMIEMNRYSIGIAAALIAMMFGSIKFGSNHVFLAKTFNTLSLGVILLSWFSNTSYWTMLKTDYLGENFSFLDSMLLSDEGPPEQVSKNHEAAIARVLKHKDSPADKRYLGLAYSDIVKVRELRYKKSPDKCDAAQAKALMKRARHTLNGDSEVVQVPDCDDPQARQQVESGDMQTAVTPTVDYETQDCIRRRYAVERILDPPVIRRIQPGWKLFPEPSFEDQIENARAKKIADENLLGAVLPDVVEIKRLRALLRTGRGLDECERERLSDEEARITAFELHGDFDGAEYKLTECPRPINRAPSVAATKSESPSVLSGDDGAYEGSGTDLQ